ncbi:MAG TPA: hypothetical protein PLA94_17580 [Myxococcota bacterium]|nr:hypothetical protein [Myxococcota bacterium]
MVTPAPSGVSTIGFEATIGDLVASTDGADANIALRSLRTSLGMGQMGAAVLELGPFGVRAPSAGDPVRVSLDVGEGSTLVFTGEVGIVQASTLGLRIVADTPLARLARMDVEAAFEGQNLAAIAADLLDRAGLEKGKIAEGPVFGSYILRRGPRAWRHLLNLAELCGLDLWCDPEGKVQLQAPADVQGDRIFSWGVDLLELELRRGPLYPDGVVAWGEGAASSKGQDRAHWLPVDLGPVEATAAVEEEKGELSAKPGAKSDAPRHLRCAALRSGEAVKAAALGVAKARAARPLAGFVRVPGALDLSPGMGILIKDLPEDHGLVSFTTNPLRLRAVHHWLDAASGLYTRLEV